MIFSVEHGSFSYKRDGKSILKDISFSAGSGDLVAVLGPNGAGKTTLLRCAIGFLKWSAGNSSLDGRDIVSIPYRELWRTLAYVPQAKGASSGATVLETVLLGRSSRFGAFSKPGRDDLAAAESVMGKLNISHLADKRCSEISGGELQMALIARALAAEPKILILDEPESNLDFKNQLLIMETMSSLAASGMTCIFNTHYPAHAMQRANKALLLGAEGDWLFGNVANVVTEENIERTFGVKAVISEIETPVNITRDVIPVMVSERSPGSMASGINDSARCLATVSVIFSGDVSEHINSLLHEYNGYLIGRMGMPYPEGGVNIINLNMDAPAHVINELSQKLGILPGVSVKATFAREGLPERRPSHG